MSKNEGWEKKIWEMLPECNVEIMTQDLIDFIHQLLAQARKEEREELLERLPIEKEKYLHNRREIKDDCGKEYCYTCPETTGYNRAKDELLSFKESERKVE